MGVYGVESIMSETAKKYYYSEAKIGSSAQDNSMSPRQANQYYKTLLSTAQSKAQTKEQIDDCIKTLNKCVDEMRTAKAKAELDFKDKDRMQYALSALVPLGFVADLFKRNDWQQEMDDINLAKINTRTPIFIHKSDKDTATDAANKGAVAAGVAKGAVDVGKAAATANPVGIATKGATFTFKWLTYKRMLDKNINNTLDAIEVLEKKKKELDNHKD